jgi:hypothetical protein
MIGDGDRGEIGGMKIGGGNRSTRIKPPPAPLCPPEIPLIWFISIARARISQSHIATDSQSVGLSRYRSPSGAYDQKLVY